MIRRVPTTRMRRMVNRVPQPGKVASLHVPMELLDAAGFRDVDEVNMEASPGIIVIGPADPTALTRDQARQVRDERLEMLVDELVRKFRMREFRDFARVCVTAGVELHMGATR